MRIATDPNDTGYKVWKTIGKARIVHIYCNGLPLHDCVMVDTKRRIALVAARDDAGTLTVNARGNRVRLRQVFGDMRIEIARRQ